MSNTQSYDLFVQTKLIIKTFDKDLTGDIRWHRINIELSYLEGYIDGQADSGEIGCDRYERIEKLIEGYRKKNRDRREVENVLAKNK